MTTTAASIVNAVRETLQASKRSSTEREQFQRPIEAMKRDNAMPSAKPSILVLISHSSKDKALAEALIELLRSALGLLPSQIRCTSVDGYRLPAGVNTDEQLRAEIKSVGVLIGLLTPNSIASTYVLFELGARWGAELFMIPLLAGITPERMQGPQRILNAVSCETEAQLIQLVEDIGRQLNLEVQSAASYLKHVRAVKSLAESIPAIAEIERSKPPVLKPNLQFRRIFEGREWFGHEISGHAADVMLIEIGNELADRVVGRAGNVRAHVTYLDSGGKQLQIRCPGSWTTERNETDIPTGESRNLMIAVLKGAAWMTDMYEGVQLQNRVDVQVRLLDGTGQPLADTVFLELRFGNNRYPVCKRILAAGSAT